MDSRYTDPEVILHLKLVLCQSASLKDAMITLAPLFRSFSDPFPYALSVLQIIANVPDLAEYARQYRERVRTHLVTEDEILQSYHREFPTWMRPQS